MEQAEQWSTAALFGIAAFTHCLIYINAAVEDWGNVEDAGSIGVFQGAV